MPVAIDFGLQETRAGVLLPVRVKPRGRSNAVEGMRNGAVLISVTAPPAEGAANAAVISVLAGFLGCARSTLKVARGQKSRDKTILINDIQVQEIQVKLNHLMA